jgi:hypothetical protein
VHRVREPIDHQRRHEFFSRDAGVIGHEDAARRFSSSRSSGVNAYELSVSFPDRCSPGAVRPIVSSKWSRSQCARK